MDKYDAVVIADLVKQVARLEGELAEVQKELESKDEELRLAREDFSPEAWEDLLQRLEKSEAAIRAKDAALKEIEAHLVKDWEQFMNCGQRPAATVVGILLDKLRAALSPDAGKGCKCGGPSMQPCGPSCKYPLTDEPWKEDTMKGKCAECRQESELVEEPETKRKVCQGCFEEWRDGSNLD